MESSSVSRLCGELILGGFSGSELPPDFAQALSEGRRGGVVLFRRNLPDVASVGSLCRDIWSAAGVDLPPLIAVDQEGGRVTRMPRPFLSLPPMRVLGRIDDTSLTFRAAVAVGQELAAAGITLNFAPVIDVDSNPLNPVIGDRSFGADPCLVSRHGVAFAAGLAAAGIRATGKHFPGHGDTSVDSHLDLPVITHDRERLDRVELVPFRAAIAACMPSLMVAHVVVTAFDGDRPATLSPAVSTGLIRGELGYAGVLFSDDLEMKAVAAHYPIEDIATMAIEAGCDALLICKSQGEQERAHRALVDRAHAAPRFLARCEESSLRIRALRATIDPMLRVRPEELGKVVGGPAAASVLAEIEARSAPAPIA